MDPSVLVEKVTKSFRMAGSHDSLRDLVPALLRRRGGAADGSSSRKKDFVAVDDVSFVVHPGEAVGIIGTNGAGKSTILKLLNGILAPTSGRIFLRGRSTALIEVSAGFHPDLTGLENIFLQGAILGMPPAELRPRVDSIIAFAGIDKFIDTPVKRYSSGMNARLGFAIAAHLDPDVLLIDEVLAVGDTSFQQKCMERMREFKSNGVAIVFVSHNLQAIGELCDRTILLQSKILYEGAPSEAIRRYLGNSDTRAVAQEADGYSVRRIAVSSESGTSLEEGIAPGTDITIQLDIEVDHAVQDLLLTVVCRRATDGLVAYDGNFRLPEHGIALAGDPKRAALTIRLAANLTRGLYSIEALFYDLSTVRPVLMIPGLAVLRIDEKRTYQGIADLGITVGPS